MEKDLLEGFARYLDSRPAPVREASNSGLPSITISRQMGSGGIEIAELLADQLAERSARRGWCSTEIWPKWFGKITIFRAPLVLFSRRKCLRSCVMRCKRYWVSG